MNKPRLAFFAEYPDTPVMREVMKREADGAAARLHDKALQQGRVGLLVWKTRIPPEIDYKAFMQMETKAFLLIEWKDSD